MKFTFCVMAMLLSGVCASAANGNPGTSAQYSKDGTKLVVQPNPTPKSGNPGTSAQYSKDGSKLSIGSGPTSQSGSPGTSGNARK